jgi:hypothetical protein
MITDPTLPAIWLDREGVPSAASYRPDGLPERYGGLFRYRMASPAQWQADGWREAVPFVPPAGTVAVGDSRWIVVGEVVREERDTITEAEHAQAEADAAAAPRTVSLGHVEAVSTPGRLAVQARLAIGAGDVQVLDPDRGLLLSDPAGNTWDVWLDADGTIQTTQISASPEVDHATRQARREAAKAARAQAHAEHVAASKAAAQAANAANSVPLLRAQVAELARIVEGLR